MINRANLFPLSSSRPLVHPRFPVSPPLPLPPCPPALPPPLIIIFSSKNYMAREEIYHCFKHVTLALIPKTENRKPKTSKSA